MPTERENDSGTARMTITPSKATAGHTPGPWQIDRTGNIGNAIKAQSGKSIYDGDDGFRTVALFMDCCASELASVQEANRQANAALIAAAPDLLAALEAILPFIPKSSAVEGGANARSANVAAADMVRAAISRATGEA